MTEDRFDKIMRWIVLFLGAAAIPFTLAAALLVFKLVTTMEW
jgi:uncharacterized membrane protein